MINTPSTILYDTYLLHLLHLLLLLLLVLQCIRLFRCRWCSQGAALYSTIGPSKQNLCAGLEVEIGTAVAYVRKDSDEQKLNENVRKK